VRFFFALPDVGAGGGWVPGGPAWEGVRRERVAS
jgi:hypothetical protein